MPSPRLSSIRQRTPHAFRLPKSYHLQHENGTRQYCWKNDHQSSSKSPWGAGLANMDIGCGEGSAQHNHQIPAHASNRITPP
eukprot:1147694-Pelagomonas_calceolata.AAC.2